MSWVFTTWIHKSPTCVPSGPTYFFSFISYQSSIHIHNWVQFKILCFDSLNKEVLQPPYCRPYKPRLSNQEMGSLSCWLSDHFPPAPHISPWLLGRKCDYHYPPEEESVQHGLLPLSAPTRAPGAITEIWEITGCSLLTTAFYCFFPLSTLACPWALRDPHFIYYSHSFLGHLISQQPCEVNGEGIRVLYLQNKALRVRLVNEWKKPAVSLTPSDS